MAATFFITGNDDADRLLAEDPLALLIGMLLHQQVTMEWAFAAPALLRERLGGRLDATEMAAMDPEAFTAVFLTKPALHRYPGSMATRTQALCQALVEGYQGRAEAVWDDVDSGAALVKRLEGLPGFGKEKARIFAAVLGKRLGVQPDGWAEACAPFSDDQPRSVADVVSPAALAQVRAFKKAKKAAGKSKAD